MRLRPTRFVVLAKTRSGSKWLVELLDSHRDIAAYGEMFGGAGVPADYGASGYPRFSAFLEQGRARHHAPVGYNRVTYLRGLYASQLDANAIGLKLVYGHLGRDVLPYFAARRVRVVHLTRANVLDAVISYEVGKARGLFGVRLGDFVPPVKIVLDARALRKRLEEHEFAVTCARSTILRYRLPWVDVCYEELVARRDETLGTIVRFLGVARGSEELHSTFAAVDDVPREDVIENLDDVREALVGSRYEWMLRSASAHNHCMQSSELRRDVWVVLPDALSTRLFLDASVVGGLHARLGDGLVVAVLDGEVDWEDRLDEIRILRAHELVPPAAGGLDKVRRRLDRALDRQLGYYPLAIRLNLRHGLHGERMHAGHPNWMLDSARVGWLPRWKWIERLMVRWHFGRWRYVPPALLERMRRECAALVLSNVQPHNAVPFLLAARRLSLPVVAHVASWDHTVGKGVISPLCDLYIVQNRTMQADLERYHGIGSERVVVTGWPQTDVYHRQRPREEFDSLVRSYGLDPLVPLVVVMGNTPTNAPYENRLVERLVGWWDTEGRGRVSLLFRPHPRDRLWPDRFAAALATDGVHVQESSFTDLNVLATLLQHAACVVANAGTILLEAIANDRPSVCVLYDEGAPPGESWAIKNVIGEHYRELAKSGAFFRADRFEDVVSGIERALADPGELAGERARVAAEIMGELDGRAAERVVDAIVRVVERPARAARP